MPAFNAFLKTRRIWKKLILEEYTMWYFRSLDYTTTVIVIVGGGGLMTRCCWTKCGFWYLSSPYVMNIIVGMLLVWEWAFVVSVVFMAKVTPLSSLFRFRWWWFFVCSRVMMPLIEVIAVAMSIYIDYTAWKPLTWTKYLYNLCR